MSYKPAHALLKFPRGNDLDAMLWLYRVIGKEPFTDLRQVLPTDELPSAPPPAADRALLCQTPVVPVARCPETGRDLRLFLFRDLSCVLYRQGPEGGPAWEVLPAALVMPADAYDIALKEVPYNERHTLPRLYLQSRQEGLYWKMSNGCISADELSLLLRGIMEARASEILAAPAVADPRVHSKIPEGARFPAFSRFPSFDSSQQDYRRLETTIRTLAILRAQARGAGYLEISVRRSRPGDPWRNPKGERLVFVHSVNDHRSDKVLAKAIRRLLIENMLELPDNLRLGTSDEPVLVIKDIDVAESNHELLGVLARLQMDHTVRDLAKDFGHPMVA